MRSTKQKSCNKIKLDSGVSYYDPTASLLDKERIDSAILECLKNRDYEGIVEVIQIHFEARKRNSKRNAP